MMIFNSIEEMIQYLEMIADDVVETVTSEAFDILMEYIVNQAYINNAKTGSFDDLYGRQDYVTYYRYGVPTFQFIDSFKIIRDTVGKHAMKIVYDGNGINYGGHGMKDGELYEFLNDGENGNEGFFEESFVKRFESQFDGMIISEFKKRGIELTKQ